MTRLEPGGTERQMIELIRRLDPARWAVHLACFQAKGAWFPRAAEAAVSIAQFPLKSFRKRESLRQMSGFARWCREHQIAVVQTAELYSNIFGLPGAALAGVPLRVGSRREINPDKSLGRIALQRAAYACAHRIVANSRAAATRLRREGVAAGKIATVSNGLDIAAFQPRVARGPVRKVVVVANLRPEKRHDVLIDAAATVLRHVPDARFEAVGGGPLLPSLLDRCHARGVRHAFTFAGHREDVACRLAASDVFVLPSESEAFPNAVIEAMATGLPIVASGVGGVRELIDHDRTGLLVPPGSPDALAGGLLRVMTEPGLGPRLGSAARSAAEAGYSFDRMVAAFEALYETELARRGVTPVALELAAS